MGEPMRCKILKIRPVMLMQLLMRLDGLTYFEATGLILYPEES